MLRLDGIIFTIINLVILYVAMRHFLIGPIQSVLAKRKELIDSQFAKAEEKEAEALELKDKYDDMLSHTKEESARILETSRENAKKEYDNRIQKAESQASQILAKAQKDIELEREKTIEDLHSQIAQVAMEAAGKILMEKVGASTDQALYNQYITGAGDSHESNSN